MSLTLRALCVTILILAASGAAMARPCPRCDPGSGDNWWSNVDVGAVGNATGPVHHGLGSGAVENTGVGLAHHDDKKGFWAYLTLCFEAWADKVSRMTGLDLHLQGNADVYADQRGADVDANVLGHDFDKTPVVGKADDLTWQADAQARSTLHAQGVDVPTVQGPPTEKLPTLHGDVCVDAQVHLSCV